MSALRRAFTLSRGVRLAITSAAMDIIAELQWRGLLADCTDLEALSKRLATGPTTLYAGFDPTSDSLHAK